MLNKTRLLVLLFCTQAAFATLYKCNEAGKIHYQDKPCMALQKQAILSLRPLPKITAIQSNNASSQVIERDAHGRIKRSAKAKQAFKTTHPCPATGQSKGACAGYVIDHIQPLACGGADEPENMQWQTVAAGKAKDRWERETCQNRP